MADMTLFCWSAQTDFCTKNKDEHHVEDGLQILSNWQEVYRDDSKISLDILK